MFVANTKKGSGFWNGLILLAIVVVGAVVAFSLMKIKADPKSPGDFRPTLGLGKKQVK